MGQAAEVLEGYGGYVTEPVDQSAISPERIHSDFLERRSQQFSAFERYHSAPYTEVDNYFEVLYYVVVTTDLLFQASVHKRVYLQVREDAQAQLYALLIDLFGFEEAKAEELDATLVDRSHLYAPDPVQGTWTFGEMMQGRVRTDPLIFAKGTHAYALLAHAETFGALLVYDKNWAGSWSTYCLECSSAMRVRSHGAPKRFDCESCGAHFPVGAVYE